MMAPFRKGRVTGCASAGNKKPASAEGWSAGFWGAIEEKVHPEVRRSAQQQAQHIADIEGITMD